ncbi:hypothetical protein BPO_1248 [Bergeyella porcorum]|uniref:Uncharacterized protein n=1 Tax=Bergeyella porcorum TaxID=1735111 RepID=A0AAU0F2D7_9FLAO
MFCIWADCYCLTPVDRAGNVTSARRSSGISDNCVVSTAIAWVKQYVKAEKANTSSQEFIESLSNNQC